MALKMRLGMMSLAALAAATLAGCSSNVGGSGQTLTLWHNYGSTSEAEATIDLVHAFETKNPGVTIKVVSQPQDNYFPLLQASAISKTSPDLAVMWTGLYAQKYESFLTNLDGLVSKAALSKENDLQYTAPSPGFETKNGSLVMPIDSQLYIGFYNKALFKKAGISTVPSTWDELFSACTKLRAIGVTPIAYGNGGAGGAEFVPWFDMSYLAAGVMSPTDYAKLETGNPAWTSADLKSQLQKWQQLGSSGCTNSDVLTSNNNFGNFESGKAAMVVDGSFDAAAFQKTLGSNLGIFAPPYTDSGKKSVVQYAGSGYAIPKASTHKREAAKFLEFMSTPEASKILVQNGLLPNVKDYVPTDTLSKELEAFAGSDGYTRYAMLDNVIQPEVADTGSKYLPSVLAGKVTPTNALEQLSSTLKNLPASDK